MANRFCNHCGTDVEDAGGFCLLGHSLRYQAPVTPMNELRNKVDQAFEEARSQVTDAPSGSRDAAIMDHPAQGLPTRPAPAPQRVAVGVGAATATRARASAPPPPPPPPPPPAPAKRSVWDLASQPAPDGPDPIASFSPAPRMDWGPERSSARGALSRLLKTAQA